jgi:hypothetical protein
MLKKNQTEHRSELANDTICSLICAKQNKNMECYEYCAEGKVKNTRESDMVIGTSHRESNMSVAHTCQPLKPSMREIYPSAMTAEGEILHEQHFQPKYMTCTLYTSC